MRLARLLSPALVRALEVLPVVVIVGPRQVGKSSLVQAERRPPELHYWRTANGREVDLVVEVEDRVIPIEVKATAGPRMHDLRHLLAFIEEHRRHCPYGVILHGGATVETPTEDIVAVPLSAVL